MDELIKNKRRAMRRKRNLIAKDLKTNKLYSPKTIEPKRKRQRLSVRDVYTEDDLDWALEDEVRDIKKSRLKRGVSSKEELDSIEAGDASVDGERSSST